MKFILTAISESGGADNNHGHSQERLIEFAEASGLVPSSTSYGYDVAGGFYSVSATVTARGPSEPTSIAPKPLTHCTVCKSDQLRVTMTRKRRFSLDGGDEYALCRSLTLQLFCVSCRASMSKGNGVQNPRVQAALDAFTKAHNEREDVKSS